jgi:hypothetical protein
VPPPGSVGPVLRPAVLTLSRLSALYRLDREHRRVGRAAGVHRQAAVGLEGVDEVALVAAQALFSLWLTATSRLKPSLVQVAESRR